MNQNPKKKVLKSQAGIVLTFSKSNLF